MNDKTNPSQPNPNKKKHKRKKKSIYFNVRVIGKVGAFIDKMKAGAVLDRPDLQKSELQYLKVDGIEKESEKAYIHYENKFMLFCQIWSYILFLIILWRATAELVLGAIGNTRVIEALGLFTCIVFGMLSINSEIKN